MLRNGSHVIHYGTEGHDTYFTLNFGLAERELVDSLTQIPVSLYGIWLLFRHELFEPEVKEVMTPQVFKHCLFWIMETHPPRTFGEDNITHSFSLLLQKIQDVVTNRICPNYFSNR